MIVNNKFILSESLVGTVTVYLILRKLMSNWEDWDAFKLGIIDKNGKKLRHPITSKERESWDMLTRFCWNLKLISTKFIGKSKFSQWITAAVLLKDSIDYFYIDTNKHRIDELNDLDFKTQNMIHELLSKLPQLFSNDCQKHYKMGHDISEEDFNFLVIKHLHEVEDVLSLYDLKSLFGEEGDAGTVQADIAQQSDRLGSTKRLKKFKKKKLQRITI